MKDLSRAETREHGLFYRLSRGVLRHSLVVPFSLKPDGACTIGKSARGATVLAWFLARAVRGEERGLAAGFVLTGLEAGFEIERRDISASAE